MLLGFGGKRTLAPRIVELLGEHVQYFEPFVGSMAVLLAKPQTPHETVNDLHGDLTNLAKVVAHEKTAETLYNLLQKVILTESQLRESLHCLENGVDSGLPRAYDYFIVSWMSRNGLAGLDRQDFQMAVRWTPGGGSPTVRFRSAVESLPAWHRRLQNVVILQRDAFEIIPKFSDTPKTAIYVDPPYARETRSHGTYLHDFEDEDSLFGACDHKRLADMLREFDHARIVVSYYDLPAGAASGYEGWHFHDATMNKQLSQQAGRGERSQQAPEVLITNFGEIAA